MRILISLFVVAVLAGCGGGGGSAAPAPGAEVDACSNDGQKQFVLDTLYDWYLWNDLLPRNIDIANYASPEELVIRVTEDFGPQQIVAGQEVPLDRFSFVRSQQAEQEFLEGTLGELFGFSYRFVDEAATDFRIVRVFAGSPADLGGLDRGQRILTLDGRGVTEIAGSEGISTYLSNNSTVTFEIEQSGANVFTTITKAVVTINPLPQRRLIDRGDGIPPVGYMQFETFISTANPVFDSVFADFIAAGVKDVVIDLRNNGGGLVSTAELLGDYLGGFANDNEIFSETEYNPDRNAEYTLEQRVSRFARLGNSIDLTRVIFIATRGTASASELVTNALDPFADVWIVGDNTYGKPVGQIGLDFCEKILRPTSFRTKNAAGFTDYFDGLPVDCPAADDLDVPIGDDLDPNIVAATTISATGGCPVIAAPDGFQAAPQIVDEIRYPELTGPPEREFAGSF